MIILDYAKDPNSAYLQVKIKCSACGHEHIIMCDRLSKCFMAVCPNCGNIDIERQGNGDLPASVFKTLLQIDNVPHSDITYTVEGQNLTDFLTLSVGKIGEKPADWHISGIYRLKNIFGVAKHKNLLNTDSFPDFETFMRWSVKNGYRDWKNLRLDEHGFYSTASTWEAKNYSVTTIGKLNAIIDSTLSKIENLANQINSSTDETSDTKRVRQTLANISQVLNEERSKYV